MESLTTAASIKPTTVEKLEKLKEFYEILYKQKNQYVSPKTADKLLALLLSVTGERHPEPFRQRPLTDVAKKALELFLYFLVEGKLNLRASPCTPQLLHCLHRTYAHAHTAGTRTLWHANRNTRYIHYGHTCNACYIHSILFTIFCFAVNVFTDEGFEEGVNRQEAVDLDKKLKLYRHLRDQDKRHRQTAITLINVLAGHPKVVSW